MSNNILEPIPANLNDYLLKYNATTLSNTTPAALPSTTNVTFQKDAFGNISACAAATSAPGVSGQYLFSNGAGGLSANSLLVQTNPTLLAINGAIGVGSDAQFFGTTFTQALGTFGLLSANAGLLLAGQTTATSATAGAATALPTAPLGYMAISLNGTVVKIPYYSV